MSLIRHIKRNKSFYYISSFLQSLVPSLIYRKKLKHWISKQNSYPKSTINDRLNYYTQFDKKTNPSSFSQKIGNLKRPKRGTVYYFDLIKYARYFNPKFSIDFKFGDITENQEFPTIVKSRPIEKNGNSVLLKLNAVRHYKFVKDILSFSEKKNEAVWRGVVHKKNRKILLEKFSNHPQCNIAEIGKRKIAPDWNKNFLSIEKQLNYKFIISIEGVDVATNLKWIMSSNSLCFMPTPKFETWFMEGKLIPNSHYVHLKDDYSDLIEKINYYASHEEEALKIIENAKTWVTQFQDKKLEKLLSLLVLEKYFKNSKQLS